MIPAACRNEPNKPAVSQMQRLNQIYCLISAIVKIIVAKKRILTQKQALFLDFSFPILYFNMFNPNQFCLHIFTLQPMQKLCCIMTIAFCLLISSTVIQAKDKHADPVAAESAIRELMDKFSTLLKARDAKGLSELLTDDGRYYGTDPGEFLCKLAMYDTWTRQFADRSTDLSYAIEKRYIRVSPECTSAVIVEQFTIRQYTPNIPWRMVSHAVKTGHKWKLDFISWNLTPRNEDIDKLNKALE